MRVQHFQPPAIALRSKGSIPNSFPSLDSDTHTLSAIRSKSLFSSVSQSSSSSSHALYPLYMCMLYLQQCADGVETFQTRTYCPNFFRLITVRLLPESL